MQVEISSRVGGGGSGGAGGGGGAGDSGEYHTTELGGKGEGEASGVYFGEQGIVGRAEGGG